MKAETRWVVVMAVLAALTFGVSVAKTMQDPPYVGTVQK